MTESALNARVLKIVEGVVSIEVGTTEGGAPNHWRVGDWRKPPIDFSIDPMSGLVLGVQVVLQEECVDESSLTAMAANLGGVVVGLDDWSTDRYRDVRMEVRSLRSSDGYLACQLANTEPVNWTRDGAMSLGWDSADELSALWIGTLSPDQWAVIDSACVSS